MKRVQRSPWRPRGRDPFTVRASLFLVDRLRGLVRLLGVDFPVFRRVLELRLRLETPSYTVRARRGSRAGAVSLGSAATVAWLVLSGFGPGILALYSRDALAWMLLGQALWIFTLALLTLTHFANVLVDPTDVGVLASRPVDDRTLFATRIAHVLAPVLVYAGCAALVPTVCGVFAFPPLAALVAYPLATLVSGLLVVGGMTLAIALALRVAGPARFQRVVFWGQVGGATVLVIASQLAPRALVEVELLAFFESRRWLGFLVPPVAEHGVYRLLSGAGDGLDVVFAVLVLALPLAIGILTLRVASRHFVAAVADAGTLIAARARGFQMGFFARLGPRVCSTREASAAYGLALALSRRDRLFLRSVLPVMCMITVMAVVMMIPRDSRDFDAQFASMGVYYVLLLGATTIEMSRLSEHPDAREWRRRLPVQSRAALMEGSAKALLCGTVLPILAGIAVILTALGGPAALGDLALAVPLTAGTSMFAAKRFLTVLPFTEGVKSRGQLDRLPRFVGLMFVMGLLIGVHVVARMHVALLASAVVGAVLLLRSGWRRLARWDPPAKRRAGGERRRDAA